MVVVVVLVEAVKVNKKKAVEVSRQPGRQPRVRFKHPFSFQAVAPFFSAILL